MRAVKRSGNVSDVKYPTLYKKSSTGKILVWEIEAYAQMNFDPQPEGVLITRHGQLGGAIQVDREVIRVGKNLGRANATTPVQQAEAEARSEWELKRTRKGYVEDLERAKAGQDDRGFSTPPMLAHRWDKSGPGAGPKKNKARFGGYAQPKYDGLRCLAEGVDGEFVFWSREGKPIGHGFDHLKRALRDLFPTGTHVLDGEFYNHALARANDFEKITSLVKDSEFNDEMLCVQLYLYDYPSAPGGFEDRWKALFGRFDSTFMGASSPVVWVETVRVADEDAFDTYYRAKLEEGYEGAMFRNATGDYAVGKRSYDLLKMKPMYEEGKNEEEFPIVGVRAGRGKMAECAVFRCRTPGGLEFDVNLNASMDQRARYLADPSSWQGKLLTVKFGNLNKRGIPRFGNGLRLREPGL